MLAIVVAEERPDLEEAKNQLIVSNAKMKQELKEIEDRILYRLSASEGSPVDDVDLIQTLEASKLKSQEIQVLYPDMSSNYLHICASLIGVYSQTQELLLYMVAVRFLRRESQTKYVNNCTTLRKH